MSQRTEQINEILGNLRSLEDPRGFENQYAVKENLAFFKAARSVFSYLRWIIIRAPKIDSSKLLELTDLPFTQWDREMHTRLVALQKKPFPGLVTPLVERILEEIVNSHDDVVVGNIGCGGMEVERQVITRLLNKSFFHQICFVGIDKSPTARKVAKKNLSALGSVIEIHDVDVLDEDTLDAILRGSYAKFVVVLCANNIFQMDQVFSQKKFNIIVHSLFKHHLTRSKKKHLDRVMLTLAKIVFEYDGYRSWPHLIPHTLTGWNYPPLLNGAVFSNLRYSTKKELGEDRSMSRVLFFKNTGHYLKEYR